MKKVLFLLGLAVVAAEPSASVAANLALEMPPILAAKKAIPTDCSSYASCSSGPCYPGCANPCAPCTSTCQNYAGCQAGPCYPGCNNPCVSCNLTCQNYAGCQAGPCYPECTANPCQPCAAAGGLNDTGITSKVGSSGQEDADFGRDKIITDPTPSDGHAGFSFTKMNSSCIALTDQTQTSFAFVKDNVTGLIWEIQADPFERPWFNDTTTTNGGAAGLENGGSNTQSYVATANTAPGWCNNTDWRLPTIKELVSLINSSKTDTATDGSYFPNINKTLINGKTNAFFWSSTPSAASTADAWALDFLKGRTVRYGKVNFNSVMLVRKAN